MILSGLTLSHFRSYPSADFSFSPQTTLIVGPNASGKTNILEAISYIAAGKSFRAEREADVIEWGEEVARVGGKVLVEEDAVGLDIMIRGGTVGGLRALPKKYSVNGLGRRMVDFVGNLKMVLFWPEHLELVTSSPSVRRRFLDSVLVQVDREYRRNLQSYERGLRQRNRLLERIKEGEADRSQLIFWDQLLIKTGGYITDARGHLIDFINALDLPICGYRLEYDKSVISPSRLDQYKNEEVAAKATLVGPHRDDLAFLNLVKKDRWVDVAAFGSRGEQRLAVLWLKLGEMAFIEASTQGKPLLLLDDIFSELDEEHHLLVLKLISRQQTILTSADKSIRSLLDQNKIIEYKTISLPIV